jgi:propionyl-CoA carboxylase alpha chain
MQEQCIALCKAVKYRSAGTIEMLADGKQNFFFLEMNTRLQVEHPITELVSGEDLVEHMLWIAAGKALPERLTKQQCLSPKGWALESRVYAEDPLRNFLPTIGPLYTYKEPELMQPSEDNEHVTVRIDTGVCEGATISMFYDPMISKLCTHAPTRPVAIGAMEKALDQYFIHGLVNNIPFLRSVYRNANFRAGKYGTGFIPQEYPTGFHGVELSKQETNHLITAAVAMHTSRCEVSKAQSDYDYEDTSDTTGSWIVALPAPAPAHKSKGPIKASELEHAYRVELKLRDDHHEVHITPLFGSHKVGTAR